MAMYDENYGTAPVLQDISRQRKLAEKLRAQGDEALNGQMVSGHYVSPSWTQHLAKGLKSYMAGSAERDADNKEKDYVKTKSQKIADFINGNQAQTVQNGTVETMPAFTPEQQDRFGSPLQGVERQAVSTPNMGLETQEQIQQRQRAMAYQLAGEYGNDPSIQLALSDMNHARDRGERLGDIKDERGYTDNREEKLYNRNRADKLTDVDAERKYQNIVMKEQQGFQITMQDKQFAQQYKMQAQSQGFAEGQQSRSQAFQSQENALNRNATTANNAKKFDQQMQLAGLKTGGGTQAQKINDTKDVLSILNQAAPLINKSTGSGLGSLIDISAAFLGNSTKGAQAASQLKALEGTLVSKMPKMSGPQSDKDVLLYKQMSGQIGDPTIPKEQKKAAMNTINELNSRYAGVPVTPLNYSNGNDNPLEVFGAQPQNNDAGYAEWKKRNGK